MNIKTAIGVTALVITGTLSMGMAVEGHHGRPEPIVSYSTTSTTQAPIETTTTTTASVKASTVSAPVTVARKVVRQATSLPPERSAELEARIPGPGEAGEERFNQSDIREHMPNPLFVAQSMVGQHPAYADKGYWCAKAVDDWATQAGVKNWVSRPGPGALYGDAVAGGRVHALPQVGDMVFFDLRLPSEKAQSDIPDLQIMHVGVVETVNGDSFGTIEGNGDNSGLIARFQHKVNDGQTIAFASFSS